MIKKLKIFAIAMLAAGATVATTNATVTPPASTNALQAVTVNLTVYGEKTGVATAIFNTADVINIVSNALGTNATIAKGATLGVVTVLPFTNTVVSATNTNGTAVLGTNFIPVSVALNTNIVYLTVTSNSTVSGTTTLTTNTNNLVIGDTAGNYYVTIVASNGVTNLEVTTVGPGGPSTVDLTNQSTLTLDASQTLAIGTNSAVPTETNETTAPISGGGTVGSAAPFASETAAIVVISNSTVVLSNAIATNTLEVSTNGSVITVELGTNATEYTNATGVTNAVYLVTATDTNVIVATNGTTPGLGSTNALTTSLTTTFTIETNSVTTTNSTTTNIVNSTNVAVVTSATEYGTVVVTNGYSISVTNVGGTALVIADKGTNFIIPPALLSITNEPSTNDIIATTTHATNGYSIKSMTLNYTNSGGSNLMYLKVQGLVKSTTDTLTLKLDGAKAPLQVTAETWTDVSGYGYTTNTDPIILGGTISVGAPVAQTGPKFTP